MVLPPTVSGGLLRSFNAAGEAAKRDRSKISSVQFSRSVMSDSLRPHESQHARPPVLIPWDIMQSSEKPEGQEVSNDSTPDYYKMKW